MTYSLKISGFHTKAQAEAFINWYEGAGEQDACIWFGCRRDEGKIDVGFMPVDCRKPYVWNEDFLEAWLSIEGS